MHLMHAMNANSNHMRINNCNNNNNNSSITTTSSASSTDSGVILIDNDHHHPYGNDRHVNDNDTPSDNETQEQQQHLNIAHTICDNDNNNRKSLNLNIENIINANATQQLLQQQQQQQEINPTNDRRHCTVDSEKSKAPAPTVMLTNNNNNNNSSNSNKRGSKSSPSVSIRSTTISIISIDENAIDSSVVDSDSELEADAEGVHGNYVVKKLGQQTTYEPNSPEIPNIGKGLTVLSQTISPFAGGGVAGDVLATPVASAAPQIGSIALTNSSDVTFGDKHFYEGPVTIQQFLIDNREKWKKSNEFVDGQDNPLYDAEAQEHRANGGFSSKAAPNGSAADVQHQPYKFIYERKKIIIVASLLTLVVLIGLTVALATLKASTAGKATNDEGVGTDTDDSDTCPKNQLCVVSRAEWEAREPKENLTKLVLPAHRIIIAHTASAKCMSQDECTARIQVIQSFHMDSFGWSDVAYNFLIGGDGRVYVGRGWYNMGSHTKGYNYDSLCIAFVGTYTISEPTEGQLQAAKMLIEEAVLQQIIVPDYRLYGARQLSSTESPGEALYKIIKKWAHWTSAI